LPNTNANNLLTTGCYGYNKDAIPGCSNFAGGYGLVIVLSAYDGATTTAGGGCPCLQFFIPGSGTDITIRLRFLWAGTWTAWKEISPQPMS